MAHLWLERNAVYQIYPASFKDTNGDGVGDIKGIISELDYLQHIGIKIIWLSPIYESPMVDMGYDISNYYKINPLFGTMEDFQLLLSEMKRRDMKLVMDLVVNHTSDKCEWFKEAIKDKDSPYRDYYIFKEGKGKDKREVPNNWTSSFTGSAWTELENEPGMFYLHLFSKEQPDLNWHNEKVVQEVEKIMNFWMDMGVFGFRCDVISCIYKESFEDGGKAPIGVPVGQEHYVASNGCHKMLKRLRKNVIEPHDGVLIGECLGATLENSPAFLEDELDTFFTFAHVGIKSGSFSANEYIKPKQFKQVLIDWQKKVDWNGVYLENHDQHRSINKYIRPGYEEVGSKMLLTLIYSLRGTPFIYQGEEFGTRDYPKEALPYENMNDLVSHFIYNLMRSYHLPKFICYAKARHNGRDDCRAPMAFNEKDGHGFCGENVKPWQIFNPLSKDINRDKQIEDPSSILSYFIKINKLRQESDALSLGKITFVPTYDDVLAFVRYHENEKLLVLLNLDKKERNMKEHLSSYKIGKTILSNDTKDFDGTLIPYGAYILALED